MSAKLPRLALVALLAAALAIGGCGGDDDEGGGTATGGASTAAQGGGDVSGELTVVGIWTGAEQRNFRAVLDGFEEQYPNVSVRYNAAGDNTPTVLSTAIEGGNPPDLATVGQPGLVRQFQADGALQPLSFAQDAIESNFPADIVELGTIDGELYSFLFKAANKSTVWYNVSAFETAGVEAPGDWEQFMSGAETIQASGLPAFSIAGADGWTLTDLFENIYLRQAGPDLYDQLAEHEIPWTHDSVKEALRTMGEVFQNNDNIVGGRQGALQTDFPTSVTNVLTDEPRGAMVIEGDFVPGAAPDTTLEPGTGYNVFPFPAVGDSGENVVVGGGDSVVLFNDTPAGRALVEYLASPEAAQIWAEKGGFSSANTQLDPSAYRDEITRTTATAIADAETFRFDMSDLAPAEFGGTPGQGEWQILQDFLANPDDVDGTAQRLERAAARAYGN